MFIKDANGLNTEQEAMRMDAQNSRWLRRVARISEGEDVTKNAIKEKFQNE